MQNRDLWWRQSDHFEALKPGRAIFTSYQCGSLSLSAATRQAGPLGLARHDTAASGVKARPTPGVEVVCYHTP